MTIQQLQFYLAYDFALFPCSNIDKSPLIAGGFKGASKNPSQIEAWFNQYPNCTWGTPTSFTYGVVDIDPRNGGDVTWESLIKENGPLPQCPTVQTGSLGTHYVMRFPVGTRCGKLGQGLDLKADGGYVVIPPSRVHDPEGRHIQPYSWVVKPWECLVPEAPSWVVGLRGCHKPELVKAIAVSPFIVQGDSHTLETHPGARKKGDGGEGQHATFLRLVGMALGTGIAHATVRVWAETWSGRCEPPYADWVEHFDGLVKRERVKGETLNLNRSNHLSPTTNLQSPNVVEGKKELGDGELVMVKLGDGGILSFLPDPLEGKKDWADGNPNLSFLPSGEIGDGKEGDDDGGILSFLPSNGFDETEMVGGESCEVIVPVQVSPFTLSPEAYHGLFGEMLSAVEYQTEAHPASILLSWLTLFGNTLGNGAWVQVGARKHYGNLYTAIAGNTSDAKGDSYSVALYPFRQADPLYCFQAIANGVGSGEGLVERVRDEATTTNSKGESYTIPACDDKRCLLRLSELSRCFKLGRRESSTLSEILREGWDGEPISIPNRGGNKLSASQYTFSVIGDITPQVLAKLLSQGTESVDGFANRFLWCHIRSPRSLPGGGNIGVLNPFIDRLKAIILKAKGIGEVKRDADAERLWCEVYPSLKVSGDSIPHTDRARPYVLRLSLLFAIADGEKVIRKPHLQAALAVWDYCSGSAATLFGATLIAEPEPLWLRLLNTITIQPGVKRSELTRQFREPGEVIGETLKGLKVKGLVYSVMEKGEGSGRIGECWYPGNGEGDIPNRCHHLFPLTTPNSPVTNPPEGKKEKGCTKGTTLTNPDSPVTNPPEGKKELPLLPNPFVVEPDDNSQSPIAGKERKNSPNPFIVEADDNSFLPDSPNVEGKKELPKGGVTDLSFLPSQDSGEGIPEAPSLDSEEKGVKPIHTPSFFPSNGFGETEMVGGGGGKVVTPVKVSPEYPDPDLDPEGYDRWLLPLPK